MVLFNARSNTGFSWKTLIGEYFQKSPWTIWLKTKGGNSVCLKIKETPEKNCVCEFSTKPSFPLTQLQPLFPVYIWPWLTAITVGPAKQAQSLPANLLVEEVFSARQVHLSRWPFQPARALLQIKKAAAAHLWNPARRPPARRRRGVAKLNPSSWHSKDFSVPRFLSTKAVHFAVLLSCSVNSLLLSDCFYCLSGLEVKYSLLKNPYSVN